MSLEINDMNKYLVSQIQQGKFDKDYALAILKKLNEKTPNQREDIAIVGMGCRLPEADTPEEFWQILKDKKNCVRPFPAEREKDALAAFPEGHNVSFFKAGYLNQINEFDAEYFNIPPRNATMMDPYQRLFLEVFIEALQDSAIRPDQIYGSNTGVFIGTDHTHKFKASYLGLMDQPDFTAMIGSWAGILSGRVSYMYNLKGPGMVLDSACSSGFSAIHAACNALYMGDCDQAIAGAVNLFVMPTDSDGQMNLDDISNSDSLVRTFDKNASGTAWGEGVCCFLLKPLSKAIKDNDPIHAVIKSVAINSDGASNGITAPNGRSQSQLIERAWKLANVSAKDISYIEAHGTGTKLGDPIEVKALNEVFKKQTDRKQFCGIGSVKTNVGHGVGVSSLISLVKVVMSLKKKQIPPTINFETPNSLIDFCNSALYIQDEMTDWNSPEKTRIAGINSFSFNGTNCHIVVAEAPAKEKTEKTEKEPLSLFTLSARNQDLLDETIQRFKKFLTTQTSLSISDVCYSVNLGREDFKHRFTILTDSVEDLRLQLNNLTIDHISCSQSITANTLKAMQNEADELTNDMVSDQLHNANFLDKLSKLYLAGADLNWNRLYEGKAYSRVHLPVFPFKKTRYWVDVKPKQNNLPAQSPSTLILKEIAITGDYSNLPNAAFVANVWGNVLGYTSINIDGHFYELGGDSIVGMQIISTINKELNLNLEVSVLLEYPNFSKFVSIINLKLNNKHCVERIESARSNQNVYAVSPAQKRMFILWQKDTNSLQYNVSGCVVIPQKLNAEIVQNAFKQLVKKHESLRTVFNYKEELMQHVLDDMHVEIDITDKSFDTINELQKKITEWGKDFVKPFDLEHGPLFRVNLVMLPNNQSAIFLDFHHIISDGTTIGIYVKDIEMLLAGEMLFPAKFQYKDFALWQNNKLTQGGYSEHEKYWRSVFEEEVPLLELPVETNWNEDSNSNKGKRISFKWNQEKALAIQSFTRKNEYTTYIFMLGCLNILLSKYSSQTDILVGSPVSGRSQSDFQDTTGLFVNTIVQRNKPLNYKSIKGFMQEVKSTALKSFNYQDYPYDLILNFMQQRDSRDANNTLINVFFEFQNEDMRVNNMGDAAQFFELSNGSAKFDISLLAKKNSAGICIDVEYRTNLYKESTITLMLDHLSRICDYIIANNDAIIGEIEFLSDEEKQQQLVNFNNTKTNYPNKKSIIDLFSEQVLVYKEKVAISDFRTQLTYDELDKVSTSLASKLVAKGVHAGENVGLLCSRSIEAVVGALAIMKLGAVYVPLDSDNPRERINLVLADCNIDVICVINETKNLVDTNMAMYIDIDVLKKEEEKLDHNLVLKAISPQDAAYIMYTSGSTGIPKGTIVSHRNVVRLVRNTNYFNFDANLRILQTGAPAFDAITFEWWGALLNGGYLHVVSKEELMTPNVMEEQIQNKRITSMWLTSSLFNQLLDQRITIFRTLNHLLVGGDVLSVSHINKLLETYPRLNVLNGYGPTENTTFSLVHKISNLYSGSIPIGKPVSNSTAYILDENLKLIPRGVIGELYFGGDGVSIGYLNDPILTSKKYLLNPYDKGYLYKSGDLGRYLPDGTVEFLGRKDAQIKIRGFRIEIGEIEQKVLSHPLIRETFCCLTNEGVDKHLVCYYVAKNYNMLRPADLKNYLVSELPAYMVPLFYKEIDILPLNLNGKINKHALPVPDAIKNNIVLPESDLQKMLFGYWQEVLGSSDFGINDDFFAIGGQSLKIMTLSSMLLDRENISMPLNTLFSCTTIREQELYLLNNSHEATDRLPNITKIEIQDSYPVTSAQKRLFALQQFSTESTAYNMPAAFKLNEAINSLQLVEVLSALIERHESLRTNFLIEGDDPVQIINTDFKPSFNEYEASSREEVDLIIKQFLRPFNLSNEKLFRTCLIHLQKDVLPDTQAIIVFDIHHIISDGISVQNLASDFRTILEKGSLCNLPVQYKDYAIWEKSVIETDNYQKQKLFWKKQFEGELPVLAIPTDFNRPLVQKFEGSNLSFYFDEKLSSDLTQLADKLGVTLHILLLSLFNVLLSIYSNQEDLVVGVPIAGRCDKKLYPLIGMFVNTLPIRSYPKREKSFANYVKEVKECSINSYENQLFGFEKIVEDVNPSRDNGRNPLFDVLFVLQENQEYSLNEYPINLEISKFDLMLQVWLKEGQFKLDIEYSTSLFKQTTIELLTKRFTQLAKSLSNNADTLIRDIDLCLPEERNKIINDFNNTTTDYPCNRSIIEIFDEVVNAHPESIALKDSQTAYTYSQLAAKANLIARLLVQKGVISGDRIGLFFERDTDWIISVLAILKLGCLYVPIGTSYPEKRINYIEINCDLKVVLTNIDLKESLFRASVIHINKATLLDNQLPELPNLVNYDGESPSYIMFTSGSTGEPKGVIALNKNVVRLVRDTNYMQFDSSTRILLTGSPVFDATTFEIWGALLNGGCLVLRDNHVLLNSEMLGEAIRSEHINTMWFTSAYFNQLCDQDSGIFEPLSYILVGGDVISPKHIYKIKNLYPNLNIINGYGPTENVTFSTTYKIEKEYSRIPIGKPISNSTAYVLNKSMKLQPIGIIGELYVGGVGLAAGYLNDHQLTNERFVKDPFGEGLLYKTGDLARLLSDGNIDFLGRIDNQIKIRGYRIEPDEIEHTLLSRKDILKTIVIPYEKDGGKSLCAYYQSIEPLKPEIVRDYLKSKLPDYMVPSYYVNQVNFELTENGKIDRRKLSKPEAIKEKYEETQTNLEMIMASLWSDVLKVDEVGRNDNFFSLGGDSIKAIQICSRLKDIDIKIEISSLFQFPVLKDICLEAKTYTLAIDQSEVVGESNLTPAQYWFKSLDLLSPNHFHQGVSIISPSGFIKEKVEKTMEKLITHHDALRISFPNIMDKMQNLTSDQNPFYQLIEMDDSDDVFETKRYTNIFKEIQSKTSLKEGCLTCLLLVHHHGGSTLWWSIHHLVVDSVSWRFLIEDFQKIYSAYLTGENSVELPHKTTSYIEWAKCIKEYAQSDNILKQIEYWEQEIKLINVIPLNQNVQLPILRKDTLREVLEFSEEQTQSLLTDVNKPFNTNVNDILVAALAVAINRWIGEEEFLVNVEGHGRENLINSVDITRTIGWFTSIYPVKIQYNAGEDLSYHIKKTKDKLHKIPLKGIGFGILKYLNNELLTKNRFGDIHPRFSFNYLGQLEKASKNQQSDDLIIEPLPASLTLSPDDKSLYPLDINSWIINNTLYVNIEYSSTIFKQENVVQFAAHFKNALTEIIWCCLSLDHSEITLSDLTSSDIDETEFSNILIDLDFQ